MGFTSRRLFLVRLESQRADTHPKEADKRGGQLARASEEDFGAGCAAAARRGGCAGRTRCGAGDCRRGGSRRARARGRGGSSRGRRRREAGSRRERDGRRAGDCY